MTDTRVDNHDGHVGGVMMETKIDEIGVDIYRLSVFVPEVAAPAGFTFKHFLILGEELIIPLWAQKDVPGRV
jgi:hypothetical protein